MFRSEATNILAKPDVASFVCKVTKSITRIQVDFRKIFIFLCSVLKKSAKNDQTHYRRGELIIDHLFDLEWSNFNMLMIMYDSTYM